jgi:Phosphoesterase family
VGDPGRNLVGSSGQDTVVLVTWDDWGGFYDDVPPPCLGPGGSCGYPNGTGGQYVYGFRVPLLVVSAYTGCTQQGCAGYISGTTAQGGEIPQYIHDFRSILNFTEYVFGLQQGGIGDVNYPYADYFAPDSPTGACGPALCPYSLSDFFNFSQTPRTFTLITGAKYPTSCFFNPGSCLADYPEDPDNDEIDQ